LTRRASEAPIEIAAAHHGVTGGTASGSHMFTFVAFHGAFEKCGKMPWDDIF